MLSFHPAPFGLLSKIIYTAVVNCEDKADRLVGECFVVEAHLPRGLSLSIEIGPDLVVLAEFEGNVVFYAYQRLGSPLKIYRYVPGEWIKELDALCHQKVSGAVMTPLEDEVIS